MCIRDRWECIRMSSYVYPSTPFTNAQAAGYTTDGFEVGMHLNTNCDDYTPTTLAQFMTVQMGDWAEKYSSLPPPDSQRTHCIAYSDWASTPKVELANGIRLDGNYYY